MNKYVYQVTHMPPERDSSESPTICGIYTTRELALDLVNSLDGEWQIIEYGLNRIDSGTAIWDDGANRGEDHAKFYLRHWPDGFPYK